jgi:hypothetical protein
MKKSFKCIETVLMCTDLEIVDAEWERPNLDLIVTLNVKANACLGIGLTPFMSVNYSLKIKG